MKSCVTSVQDAAADLQVGSGVTPAIVTII